MRVGHNTTFHFAQVPGIIHSTVLRFTEELSGDRAAMVDDIFQATAAAWAPVLVRATKLHIAIEDVPYMHMASKETNIAATFDLVSGEATGWALR